jgi:hypothetical protein
MDLFQGLNLDSSINSFQTNTNNSMKTVKDNTLTPADVTTSRMKQGVALKTAKDTGVKGTITAYRSAAVEQLDGIIGALSGGFLNTKDITKAIKIGRDGVTFSEDSIISAIGKDVGVPVSGQSGAMRALQRELTKQFKELTGYDIGGVLQTDGSTFRINKNWRGAAGKQTLKMVGGLIGLDEFVDVSVRGAFYNATLFQAADYGMSHSYRRLWDSYPKGFELIRRDAAIDAMRTLITNGDIESIDVMIGLLNTEGRNTLLSKYPDFVELLFSNFKFDSDMYPENYPALRDKLLGVLNALIGPNWYMKYTEFGYAYNLALINKVSKDMKTLLGTVDYLVPLLCAAGMFNDQSAVIELKHQFKNTAQYAF